MFRRMHPDVAKLVEAGRIPQAVGERLSQLAPGCFCQHKAWGIGKVSDWDLLGGKVTIDFAGQPAQVPRATGEARQGDHDGSRTHPHHASVLPSTRATSGPPCLPLAPMRPISTAGAGPGIAMRIRVDPEPDAQ